MVVASFEAGNVALPSKSGNNVLQYQRKNSFGNHKNYSGHNDTTVQQLKNEVSKAEKPDITT